MEMEVEVVLPVPAVDFNFDSTCSSPYMTAPSSPQRFGNFFLSAPASPSRISSFYRDFNEAARATNSAASSVPFDWEEKPGTPKQRKTREDHQHGDNDDDVDFEFNFSGHLERTSLSADELFDCGKIRPLKPPPGYDSSVSSPKSPKSRNNKDINFDPFEAAAIEATKELSSKQQIKRGRDRRYCGSFSSSSNSCSSLPPTRRGSRSLSPLRVSDIVVETSQSENIVTTPTTPNSKSSYASSILAAISFSKGYYKKWKLKDFLLFRSASEGRAIVKDPLLTKFAVLSKKEEAEDVKNASFRSTDSSVGSSRRRGPPLSAHEVHYTVNRALSEELKRKTFLPYKQGLLGCLGFNPGVHDVSIRGAGSMPRG